MSRVARGSFGSSCVCLALCVGVPVAQAQVAQCAEQDATICGRRHFEAGTAAFERGDFAAARLEFEAAIARRPHPVIHFNLALTLTHLGRPTAALEQLQVVLADPATDEQLRARAQAELRGGERAVARVSFSSSDPARDRVELDGRALEPPQKELRLDPGPHHVRIFSGGSLVLDQNLDLAAGERVELRVGERSRRIDVVVAPEPAAEARPAPAAEEAPMLVPATTPTARPLHAAWFYVGVATSVVLGGVTVWSGLDTQRALSDYERDLPQLSQAAADERVGDGHARERRTNWLLAGSIGCAVGTAVMGVWFVDFRGAAAGRVAFGPGRVTLSASF